MVAQQVYRCTKCLAQFDFDFALEAHIKGHESALKWADEIKREKVWFNDDENPFSHISRREFPQIKFSPTKISFLPSGVSQKSSFIMFSYF